MSCCINYKGYIFFDSKKGYRIFSNDLGMAYGIIEINKNGNGFVHTKDGYIIFISLSDLNGALNGDAVIVYGISNGRKNEFVGKIKQVVKRKKGMNLNSQQLRNFSEKFKLHEMGEVEIEDFTNDYCIHEVPFASFMNIEDELNNTFKLIYENINSVSARRTFDKAEIDSLVDIYEKIRNLHIRHRAFRSSSAYRLDAGLYPDFFC